MGFVIGLIIGILVTAWVVANSIAEIEKRVYMEGFLAGQEDERKNRSYC